MVIRGDRLDDARRLLLVRSCRSIVNAADGPIGLCSVQMPGLHIDQRAFGTREARSAA